MSYIHNDEVVVNDIPKEIKQFLNDRKKELCKNEQECGEVTIIIKFIDLLNNAIRFTLLSNNIQQLNDNLKIIDFFDKYISYKLSITNIGSSNKHNTLKTKN